MERLSRAIALWRVIIAAIIIAIAIAPRFDEPFIAALAIISFQAPGACVQ